MMVATSHGRTSDAGSRVRERQAQAPGKTVAAAMQQRPWLVLASLTLLFVVVVVIQSSIKLLWLDELITLTLARLGSAPSLWGALLSGVDPNPPGSFLLVMLSRHIFGEGALALRLPAALGYWCGVVGIFVFLKRRVPVIWAAVGTLLSMAMAAFDFSFEARSYGLIYGTSMLSWLCWSVAVDARSNRRRRVLGTFGMAFALALGVSINYFAVLATLPILAGEVVRTWGAMRAGEAGAFRPAIWLALIAGAVPLLVFRRLMEHAIKEFAPYAFNRVSPRAIADGYTEMVESTLLPLLVIFVCAGLVMWMARGTASVDAPGLNTLATRFAERSRVLPLHEFVAVVTVMGYPVLGYIVASVHGGMLSARFVNPVCLGFAIAGAVTLYRLSLGSGRVGIGLLCLFLAWFCARESYVAVSYAEQRASFQQVQAALAQALQTGSNAEPIVIPDPLLAMPLDHYAAPGLRQRLAFPLDFAALRAYRHNDSPEENLWAARALLPTLHIQPLRPFEQAHGDYLVVAGEKNWLLQTLADQHRAATRLSISVPAANLAGFTPLGHGPLVIYAVHDGDVGQAARLQAAPALSHRMSQRAVVPLDHSRGGS